MMLPIILIPDILGLSRSELKENGSSIFYLAVVAVIISIIMAVAFTYFFIDIQNFSIYHLLILFTPLMATDVVSVIVCLSIGLLGYLGFKYARDNFGEFIAIYLMASISFLITDRLELSAILAVVISILFFKYLFDKEGHYKKKNYAALLMHFNSSHRNSNVSFRAYQKESQYLGLFANAVIFISIANVINLEMLLKYKMKILYVFVLTTLIRYLVIVAFTIYKKHPFRWGNILMLSGMKGGLALIMIVSLSETTFHKEMFFGYYTWCCYFKYFYLYSDFNDLSVS